MDQKEKEIKIGDKVTLVLPAGSFQYRQLGRGSKECVVNIQIRGECLLYCNIKISDPHDNKANPVEIRESNA